MFLKNYITDGKGEEKYILEVIKNSNGTLTIKFADGRVFRNILACDDNIAKIIATQEEQAKRGIASYRTFVKKANFAKAQSAISGAIIAGIGTGIAISDSIISSQNPIIVAAGIGVVTILGMTPGLVKLVKNKGKIKELDKLRFRNEHIDDLREFRNYPNALSGVESHVVRFMRGTEDPFSILEIDQYQVDDLEQMMTNINVEKEYGFTYKKANSRHQ